MIALVFATEKEFKSALGPLGAPKVAQGNAVEWTWSGRTWLACVCGVGLVNAGLMAGTILADKGVRGLVNMGLGGSYDLDRLGLGELCLARWEIWPEYGLAGSDSPAADPRGLGLPLARTPGGDLWDRVDHPPDDAARAMGLSPDPVWPWVAGVTVSTLATEPQAAAELGMACGAEMENMEGFALAYGCALAGLPFLELRAISNLAGSRKSRHWDLEGGLAALADGARRLLAGK